MFFIFYQFIKIIQFWAIKFTNFFKFLFYVHMFQCWEIFMQVFWNTFTSWFQLCVPLFTIVVLRQRQFIHDEIILHFLFLQYNNIVFYILIKIIQQLYNREQEQIMQTFKEISYQNYIQLRFNQKNLQETQQQEALLKYKRNAQLLSEIFSFQKKPKTSFKAEPVITQQHLKQMELEVQKQKKEGQLKCKQIQEKSKNYCELLKKIKKIKTEQQRNQIIEELKAADLYDQQHPYFAQTSPFFLNSTDAQVLEVTAKYQLPDESTISLLEIK